MIMALCFYKKVPFVTFIFEKPSADLRTAGGVALGWVGPGAALTPD